MNKFLILCLLCLLSSICLFGHEGHHHTDVASKKKESIVVASDVINTRSVDGKPTSWMQWIGSFHFIFLHFPIALIAMTAISELLFSFFQRPIFEYASRFMLISAAVISIPTALLGLTYSYTTTYSGLLADYIFWHMWLGIATAIFAILLAYYRERFGRNKLYLSSLFLLLILVNATAYFGGEMTFGIYQMPF